MPRKVDHDPKDAETITIDAQRALQIRFKFQEFEFGFVWSCLQEAGWTYRGSKLSGAGYQYLGPGEHGPAFDSWELVVEYLDQFAFPDVYGNLELITSIEDFKTTEEIQLGMELRQQALQKVFENSKDELKKIAKQRDDNHDEDDSDQEAIMEIFTATRAKQSARSSKRLGSTTQTDEGTELYLHGQKASKNGRKRAAVLSSVDDDTKLELPSVADVALFLHSDAPMHADIVRKEDSYKSKFPQWRFLLSTNHSLLFFGAGSKYQLLLEFCDHELAKEGLALQIDGFSKDVSMDKILDLLVHQCLGGKEPAPLGRMERHDGTHNILGESNPWRAPGLVERAILVSRAYAYESSETLQPVFLVIHSLDAESLRSERALEALAALVVNSNVGNNVHAIRLVASVDHITAPELIFAPLAAANFAWIYLPVHNHRPYVNELCTLRDATKKAAKVKLETLQTQRVRRVEEVLDLLAPRHTEVMQVLARLQLEQKPEENWVKMQVFRKKCKETHIIAKDSALDQPLNELKDHGLIQIDRRSKVGDFIRAPFDHPKLHQVLKFRPGQAGSGNRV